MTRGTPTIPNQEVRTVKSILTSLALLVAATTAAHAAPIVSASVEIPGTFLLDFETGTLSGASPAADIWWEQVDANTRVLNRGVGNSSFNDSALFALGVIGDAGYAAITETDLFGYAYGTTPIAGPPGGTQLDIGGVFAVRTVEGNYAKAIVERFDNGLADREFYDIHIRYELFAPVPEPSTYALMAAGLLGLGFVARRRKTS
jgi:hypothetical protein